MTLSHSTSATRLTYHSKKLLRELEWPTARVVKDPDTGRYALHRDGRKPIGVRQPTVQALIDRRLVKRRRSGGWVLR